MIHAYFRNRYGPLPLCHTHNPQLWPDTKVHNTETTCAGCIDMLARRVERALVEHWMCESCAYGVTIPSECTICG